MMRKQKKPLLSEAISKVYAVMIAPLLIFCSLTVGMGTAGGARIRTVSPIPPSQGANPNYKSLALLEGWKYDFKQTPSRALVSLLKIRVDLAPEYQPRVSTMSYPLYGAPYQVQSNPALLAAAVRSGLDDGPGVRRDIGALLAWLRVNKPEEVTQLLGEARGLLSGEDRSLNLLSDVEVSSQQLGPTAPFGPVTVTTPGAVERLALLARVARLTGRLGALPDGADAFASKSGATPQVFEIASKVQEALGASDTNGGLWWRDEVIPAILQSEWQNTQFVSAAAGGSLPEGWQAAASWLGPWLAQRRLAVPPGAAPVDGFLRPRRPNYRPAAAHPLVLHLLRVRLLDTLDTDETKQFFTWLAGQATFEPETAFSAGILILEAAGAKGLRVDESGGLQGEQFWAGISRQVLDSIVRGSNTGQAVDERWRDKHARLDELYRGAPSMQRQVLGAANGAEALRLYGQTHMAAAWGGFNAEAKARAATVLTASAQEIGQSAEQSVKSRERLDALTGNPLTALWLPKVSQADPPKSLEAGVTLRWYMAHLSPRDLGQAIEKNWGPLVNEVNRPQNNSGVPRLAAVDMFSPWEATRGLWTAKAATPAPAQALSPWQEVSESAVIGGHLARVRGWLEQPGPLPNDPALITSLTALCWFGVPAGVEPGALKAGLDVAAGGMPADASVLLDAYKLHLTVTMLQSGENLDRAFADSRLLGTNEVVGLPAKIEQLYRDGRPLTVRAAAETAWYSGIRALVVEQHGSADAAFSRETTLRSVAGQSLDKLDEMLTASVDKARGGEFQSGLGLSLTGLEVELHKATQDLPASSRRRRKEALLGLAGNALPQAAVGTSPWGVDVWLELWQQELDRLSVSRTLTVAPVAFSKQRMRESHNRHLGALAAFLSGKPAPSGGDPTRAWQEPGLWANFARVEAAPPAAPNQGSSITPEMTELGAVVPGVRISSVPWVGASTPLGMIRTMLDRSAVLSSRTAVATAPVDLDGLNSQYLPRVTWAAGQRELDSHIEELKRLEGEIRGQNGQLELIATINSLKPMLAAPLVVNLASFRDELSAAVGEVRRAEASLESSRSESIAADLEVSAQQLLTRIYALERERTSALQEVRNNEVRIAELDTTIRRTREEIFELEKDAAANKVKIGELNKKIAGLETEKGKVHVAIAARAVAAIQNQVKLLEDLIYTPTPVPDEPAKVVPGQLGVIAYVAQKKVAGKLADINGRRDALKRQLDDMREASLIRGITKFIGAVVGLVIGGPAGIQMGALIGEAAGGVIAGIKQGKPFLQILEGTLQTGTQIAAAAGVNLKGELKNLGPDSDELAQTLEEAQQVIGPLLRELPSFLDRRTLDEAMRISGVSDPLKDLLNRVREESIARFTADAAGVAGTADKLVGGVPGVLLSGTPDEIRLRLKNEALNVLRGAQVDPQFRRAAAELGVVLDANFNEDQVREQMAEKIANLGVVRAAPLLRARRDQLVSRLLISTTSLQAALRKRAFASIEDALNSNDFRSTIPVDEYEAQTRWLRRALAGLSVTANRELKWDQLQPKLREALKEVFPNDFERLEFVMGQFQMQLDSDGMQAEIQRALNPWNRELNERMARVEQDLAQPCTADDQEERIECQISVLNGAARTLESRVLNWLQDDQSPEVVGLRADLASKKAKLVDAQDHLQVENLNLEQALRRLEEAGLLKEQAELGQKIAALAKSVSTLSTQQADIVLQNANLELRRVRLQEEQDALNELSSQNRAAALSNRLQAARAQVTASQASLDAALARARAARSRSIVYGRVEGWYRGADASVNSQAISELYKLSEEHRQQVTEACTVVRDMLRFLRVSGGDITPFSPPSPQTNWSAHLEAIKKTLDSRYRVMGIPSPDWFEIPLSKEQIRQLWCDDEFCDPGGLSIVIDHQDENKVPALRANKVDQNWYPIAPQSRHERVFLIFLMAEDESGNVVDQSIWRPVPIEHDPVAPVLEGTGTSRERRFLLTRDKMRTNLLPWGDKIGGDGRMSQQTVFAHVLSFFQVAEFAGILRKEQFQREQGMPLTGRYHFRMNGVPPRRAKLVLIFMRQPQV